MFANDLILITNASRTTAKNSLLCLNIYFDIIGQKPNLSNLAIYLPSWCNKKFSKSIPRIMGTKLGSFLFFYLGAPISPKRLPVNRFNLLQLESSRLLILGIILLFL